MPTVTLERLEEIATAWRRGLDADELTNPAGPIFTGDGYAEYEITATGGGPTVNTIYTDKYARHPGVCVCCDY